MEDSVSPTSFIEVNLASIRDNYRVFKRLVGNCEVSPVIKANGYGLGAFPIFRSLYYAGARSFYLAQREEALALKQEIASSDINFGEVSLRVLCGILPGEVRFFAREKLTPVINSLVQLHLWRKEAENQALDLALHLDTGMNRLGLGRRQQKELLANPDWLTPFRKRLYISHLHSSDEGETPATRQQLADFISLCEALPPGTRSLANSCGAFLSPEYHLEEIRPGVLLYGGKACRTACNSTLFSELTSPLSIKAKILQVREIAADESVGYGQTWKAPRPSRLAIVAFGYADGFWRSFSNRMTVKVMGQPCAIVGRVSMDMLALDVSNLSEKMLAVGDYLALCDATCDLDEMTGSAGGIVYEFLTRLSTRTSRRFTGE